MTAVEVVTDPGEPWEEANRASYKAMWLTGPVNSDERVAEQSHDDDGLYGGVLFDV